MSEQTGGEEGMLHDTGDKSLIAVVNVMRMTVESFPIGSERDLYETIPHRWFDVHRTTRTAELDDDEKQTAFELFYNVPATLNEKYFSQNKMPRLNKIEKMLEVWASTGLEFDSSAYDKLQLGRNVNAFIAKRCNVQVDENREELLQLGNLWKKAKRSAETKLEKRQKRSPAKRLRLDGVPWVKPEITIRQDRTIWIEIPQPDNGYNKDFFQGMIEIINHMTEDFPNTRNRSEEESYRPATSHIQWAFKTAALIAYHIAMGNHNNPLSDTVAKYATTERWSYNVNDNDLKEKMITILTNTFKYNNKLHEKSAFAKNIKGAEAHFHATNGLGQFLTTWSNKAREGGVYYVTKLSCTKAPSGAVLAEHYLFLDACGLWDRVKEDETNGNII
jgi:hypothetical protein